MISIFHELSHKCSRLVTERYSTSFASAIRLLHKDLRAPIRDVYGFVRFADEIVDSFHGYDKAALLAQFERDTWQAINDGISLNPVLNSFQHTVRQYNIPASLIEAFLHSMKLDLEKSNYETVSELDEYIYGSAEVVGLMCLCVFCEGNVEEYEKLVLPARKLGSVFQKINFLRDLKEDINHLHRSYFPGINMGTFDEHQKHLIETELEKEFKDCLAGIRMLPLKARLGVYTAYRYYYRLFKKIRSLHPATILQQRVSVPNFHKAMIVLQASMYNRLNLI